MWPWVPIFIWLFAIYESYLIYNNQYKDLLQNPKARVIDFVDKYTILLSERFKSFKDRFQLRQVTPSIRIMLINIFIILIHLSGESLVNYLLYFMKKSVQSTVRNQRKGQMLLFLVFLRY